MSVVKSRCQRCGKVRNDVHYYRNLGMRLCRMCHQIVLSSITRGWEIDGKSEDYKDIPNISNLSMFIPR